MEMTASDRVRFFGVQNRAVETLCCRKNRAVEPFGMRKNFGDERNEAHDRGDAVRKR